MKKVDASDNPGLSKLPTEVRNKMGYMKKGGMAKMHKMPDGKMMKDSDMPKKKMNMGGMAYAKGTQNWQAGFAILYVDKDKVTPVLVPIEKDCSFVVEGKRYG